MANRFNHFGVEGQLDPTDGSLDIWGSTLRASNLGFNLNVGTDNQGRLVTLPFTNNAGGLDTQVQFNNFGSLDGDAAFTWDTLGQFLIVNGLTINDEGNLDKSGGSWIHNLGTDNFGAGIDALSKVSNAIQCTAVGVNAATNITFANDCTAVGYNCLATNAGQPNQTAYGSGAAENLQSAGMSSAFGYHALNLNEFNSSGNAFGFESLAEHTGNQCCGFGDRTLRSAGNGAFNCAFGSDCLFSCSSGDSNTCVGRDGMAQLLTGSRNTGVGDRVMDSGTAFNDCVALGFEAGIRVLGNRNSLLGALSGFNLSSGEDCVFLGYQAGMNITTTSNNICIQNVGQLGDVNKIRIGNPNHDGVSITGIHGITPTLGAQTVIVDPTGELGSMVAPLVAAVQGLGITSTGVSSISIGTGECRSSTDTFNIINSVALVNDITIAAAGGLDTGVEAADTWYYVHLIGDSNEIKTTTSVVSLSETAPTIPPGYDEFRMIGAVRNDASSDYYQYQGVVQGAHGRLFWWDETEVVLEVLTGGVAETWASVSVAEFSPPNATVVYLNCNNVGASDPLQHFTEFRGIDQTITTGPIRIYAGAGVGSGQFIIPTPGVQTVQYQNSAGSMDLDVHVVGFSMRI